MCLISGFVLTRWKPVIRVFEGISDRKKPKIFSAEKVTILTLAQKSLCVRCVVFQLWAPIQKSPPTVCLRLV